MGTQYRHSPVHMQSNEFCAMKPKKNTAKRNTSFTNPSVSYTNRITCPARQAFYKNMEDNNCFTHEPKPVKKSIMKAASNTCPMHCRSFLDPDRSDDERPMSRNTNNSKKPIVGRPNRTSIQRQILSQALLKQQHEYENSMKKPSTGHGKKKTAVQRYPSQGTYPMQLPPANRTSESTQAFCKVAKMNSGVYNANENLSSSLKYGMFNNCRRRLPRSVTVLRCHSPRYPATPELPLKKENKVYRKRQNPRRGPPPNSPIYAYHIPEVRDISTRFLTKSNIMHIDIKPNIYRNFTPKNSKTACRYASNDIYRPRKRSPTKYSRSTNQNWFLQNRVSNEVFSPTFRSVSSFNPLPTCCNTCNIHNRFSNNKVASRSNYESFNRNVSSPYNRPNRIVSLTNRVSSPITKNHSYRDFKRQESPKRVRKNIIVNTPRNDDKNHSNKYMHRKVLSSDNVDISSSMYCCKNPNCFPRSPRDISPRKMSSVSSTYRTISPEFSISPMNIDCRLTKPITSPPIMSEIHSQTEK